MSQFKLHQTFCLLQLNISGRLCRNINGIFGIMFNCVQSFWWFVRHARRVSAWLKGLRSPFTGDIDTPWVVDADDHEILGRLTDAAEYNSGEDLWLVIREWTVFTVHKSVDVQNFLTMCTESCNFGVNIRCPEGGALHADG